MKQLFLLIGLLFLFASCSENSNSSNKVSTIIPQPNTVNYTGDEFQLTSSTLYIVDDNNTELKNMVSRFSKSISKSTNIYPVIAEASEELQKSNTIKITISPDIKHSEGYNLEITHCCATITAATVQGAFYGLQTIRQLLPGEVESTTKLEHVKWVLPTLTINDAPRFSYRGMHLDVSRHFFTVDEVKTYIDYLAQYKFNRLHLHLTDDQGWRIAIDKYPLLTEKGAWRTYNSQDSTCIKKSADDDAFIIPEKNHKIINGEKMYGGFYTKDDMREIIKYAQESFITIVPEIDMPGHFKAAVDNYPYLSCTGEPGWGSSFSFPACLGKEGTYEFMDNILEEICELFPGEYIHIGGDEVNIKSYTDCPHCQKAIKDNKLGDEHELQSHFNKHIEKYLNSKGKKFLGWDEITEGGLTGEATVMWWRNWAPKALTKAANNGSDIIMTPDFEYYFDFTNKATPLSKVYNFDPIPASFTPEQKKFIVGVQANVWTERIPSMKRVHKMIFPRMLALAETAWSSDENKNYDTFLAKLDSEYNRLDNMGINYYIDEPTGIANVTAFTNTSTVTLNAPNKDTEIYYTLDGSAPTKNSTKYTSPFEVTEDCTVKVRGFKGKIMTDVLIGEFKKQIPLESLKIENPKAGLDRWFIAGQSLKLAELNTPKSTPETTEFPSLKTGETGSNFSVIFEGYFKAETEGIYAFTSTSDDGDHIYIADELVVDNGGAHASVTKTGMIALKPGFHKLRIVYHQWGGGLEYKIKVASPDGEELNNNIWFH